MSASQSEGQRALTKEEALREYKAELAILFDPGKWPTEGAKRSTYWDRENLYNKARDNMDLANLQISIDIIRSLNAMNKHAQHLDPKIPKNAQDKEQQEIAHKLADTARTQMKKIAGSGENLARQILTDPSPAAQEERVALKNILGAYDQLGILCKAESYKDPAKLSASVQKPLLSIQDNLGPMQKKDRWKDFSTNTILWAGLITAAVGLALCCTGFGAAIGGPVLAAGLTVAIGALKKSGDDLTPNDLADANKQDMRIATGKMTHALPPEGTNPNAEVPTGQDRGQVYTRPTNLSRSTTVTPSSQEQQIQTEADNSQKQSRHFRK